MITPESALLGMALEEEIHVHPVNWPKEVILLGALIDAREHLQTDPQANTTSNASANSPSNTMLSRGRPLIKRI